MERRTVMSREYKVMLRPRRFRGNEKALLEAAKALWHDFSATVKKKIVVGTEGDLTRIATRRLITFYDTRDRLLNEARYIFRERRAVDGSDRDITLKFRHPDRYVAQDRNMDASGSPEARTKFEEDIKAPFLSLYSFSTRLMIDDSAFKTLGDIRLLFADVADKIDKFQDNTKLAPVNRFTARELVLAGANLQVGKTPRVDAECGLIVWYDDNGARDKPVAVELSYRYGNKDEEYGGGVTRRAFQTFHALQSKLTKWVDPESRTKTAFVYQ
jgi:hypothetical protein